jgi:hypothetical protein
MNAIQTPVEETSIESLIAKGKQESEDTKNLKSKMISLVFANVPKTVMNGLIKDSVKVDYTSYGATVRAEFMLPDLKHSIDMYGHVHNTGYGVIKLNSECYASTASWYYKSSSGTYVSSNNATSMEHAIFCAYEQEKKDRVI